ncbi:hypothetical protein AB0K00_36485 [Dactylosporangium sp. NPDC049525]|uniref:hypothetical protein n=1 Tax=Dactylosporangium sp. NPDC049525 TaxID=3154730 RepID=UPI00343DAB61
MYDGLDAIDWASMQHAYGPAVEVPDLLRGLVDADPAVREESLDAMYHGVHHQGDVYDCTLAAVPFLLEALTTPGLPGRDGIAELLAGIGAAESWPFEDGDDDEDFRAMVARIGQARRLIAGTDLRGLAADPDPRLRAAMPPLLAIGGDDAGTAELFLRRFGAETDGDVRRALLDGLGRIAVRTGDRGIVAHLLGVAAAAPEASAAAAARIAVARVDPTLVPVDGVAGLLERAYAEEAAPAEPAGFTTNTLTGTVRVMMEQANEGRRAPHAARLVDRLTDALGPRVAERTAILQELLRSPHADVAGDALFGAVKLVEGWRGEHAGLIRLIGGRLSHPDPRVVGNAAVTLRYWAPLTAVVAEPVAAALAALDARPWRDGLPAWTVPSRSDPPGLHPALEVLARLGDERALPSLLTTLELARRPRDSGYLLARYPQHAERIVAAMLPVLPPRPAAERRGFHAALQAFGAAAAAAVPWLLAAPLDDDAATTLGRIGPGAAEAVPALRAATTGDDAQLAVAAAGALWRIEGSPDVLPLLAARIDGAYGGSALREIAGLGSAAADAAPYVATFLDAPDRGWWLPMRAAVALWRMIGDAERTAPVLTAAWHGNPHTRNEIAAAVAGPLTAALAPLLRAELADPRRHGARETGWSSAQVTDDERLLAACRTALDGASA